MGIRLRHAALGAVAFNVALVLLTAGLSLQAELQNPMEGRLFDVNGVGVHAIGSTRAAAASAEEGAYDALVLLHGASTSALDFKDNLLETLSEGARVVALDRPGHGYSERGSEPGMDHPGRQAEIVLAALAAMDITRPVIIGHSWAGSVVLAAMLAEHDAVDPVAGVLIAGVTHPYEREHSAPTRLALAPYTGLIFRWQYLAPIGRMALEPTVERVLAPDEVPDGYVESTGLYLSLRPETFYHNAKDRSALSGHLIEQAARYDDIDVPLLSIAATEDHVVPPADHHRRLLEDYPGTVPVEIAGAGHSPHHTRTGDVVDAIESFLEQLR